MQLTMYGEKHIASLTGLRGVAAAMVVIYHFHRTSTGLLQPFFESGGALGVMIFFALSGYILDLIYRDAFSRRRLGRQWREFIWKRLARIYPIHLLLLVIVLFTYPLFTDAAASHGKQLLANLLLIQAWGFDELSFIAASWSISIEFLCYLIFPLVVLNLTIVRASALYIALAALHGAVASRLIPISDQLEPYLDHRIFGYGSLFILGVCVRRLSSNGLFRRAIDNNVAFSITSGLLVVLPFFYSLNLALMALIIPLFVRTCHTATMAKTLLGGAKLVWLGEVSYVLYLSHQLVHDVVIRIDHGLIASPIYEWGCTYILLFFWCLCVHLFIEKPARIALRDYRILKKQTMSAITAVETRALST